MSDIGQYTIESTQQCFQARLTLEFNDPSRYFYIKSAGSERKEMRTKGGKTYSRFVCEPHPQFAPFHALGVDSNGNPNPTEADPRTVAVRRTIYANVIHAEYLDWVDRRRNNPKIVGPHSHPRNGPSCYGDGKRAMRWFNDNHMENGGEYREIECPDDKCQFAQTCKPRLALHFRVRWSALDAEKKVSWQSPIVRYVTSSWHTNQKFQSMINLVTDQSKQLGVENFSWYGFPFIMTSETESKIKNGVTHTFPVVRFAPEGDLVAWFARQAEMRAQLSTAPPMRALSGPTLSRVDEDDAVVLNLQ